MTLLIGATKRNNAFTLIEILLVIVIIGIVLALSVPNFSKGYSHFELGKTADDLLKCSRWAQAMAMGQERIYAISFSDDHRSYDLVRAEVNEETGDQDSFEPVNGILGRMHTIPDSIQVDTENDHVDFYPDGTIEPATIQLTSPGQKTILSSIEMRGMMTREDDNESE